MWNFCQRLFDPSGFPPRWECGFWPPGLGWLYIASDLAVWSAYFAISCVLTFSAVRRKDLPFRGVVFLFIAFILLCGLTHLMDAVVFWWPAYRLAALLAVVTALVSWVTVIALFRVVPRFMALRAPSELEAEIAERRRAEHDLRALQVSLERQVAERTAALEESEKRFRGAFDASPIGMALVAADGRFLRVNGSLCDLLGYSTTELLTTDFQTITHPEDLDLDLSHSADLLAGRRTAYHLEKRFRHKHGRAIHTHISVLLVGGGAGVSPSLIKQIQDITERKRAELALQASEERLRLAIEVAGLGVMQIDYAAGTADLSPLAAELFDLPAGVPVTRAAVHARFHPDDRAELERRIARCLDPSGDRCFAFEHRIVRTDGSVRWLSARKRVFFDGNSPGSAVLIAADVTERKRSEGDLRASEERFQAFMHHAPIAAWMVDEEFRGVYASPGFDRLTGLAPGSLLGRTPSELFPSEVAARHLANCNRVLDTGLPVEEEEALVGWDGSPGVAYVVKFPVRGASGRTLIGSVAIDITERKKTEELIKASLREKEVLLKEIHHRVKNNLQIVCALLELQSHHTQDGPAAEMFRESQERVRSMALIHERLYRAQDMARVDFAEYTRQLAGDLFRTYKVSGDIRLELAVDIPALSIDIAIPCGLLLNELISNCLKHAFAGRGNGCIRVALHRDGGTNVVTVADDGAGFPPGTDFRNSPSFGLQLVNTLVDQLDGESVMTADRGTTFTVRFPGAPISSPERPIA